MPEFGGRDFDEWTEECMVCTDFAAEFKKRMPEAKIKFGTVESQHGTEEQHAWAYDAEEDVTVDATLGQFFGVPEAKDGFWKGEEHPVAQEQAEFETLEEFAKGPGGKSLLE